jgi:predicted metal-binding membrane protein
MASSATGSIGGHDHRWLITLVIATSALAWFVLWRFGASPYVHYMHHAHLHAPPIDSGLLGASIFVSGWTLMTVAMMLPTSGPLLAVFSTVARQRSDRAFLVMLVVAGYLASWAAFGLLAYGGAVWFRAATARSGWLSDNGWILGAGTLLVAGAYQFTALKHQCLDRCRSPFSFVVEHWTGEHHRRQALWLGLHHGLFCVGCCWTLMLLMFPFGAGNLGWMLLLGTVMAVEKNFPWGRAMAKPVGVVLLALGLLVTLRVDTRLW